MLLVGCSKSPPPGISILDAATDGNIEAVKKHLAAGMDVNTRDNNKWTPLHDATSIGHKEIVELLLAKGAGVNAKNNYGDTPLDLASGETADLIRKHGGKSGKWNSKQK